MSLEVKRLSTQSPLDKILNGGVEHGSVTNIYGPPGAGKTNIVLLTALGCIRDGSRAVYIDTEGSFSPERFAQLGGTEEDMKSIFFLEAHEWKEQHRQVKDVEALVKKDVRLIIIDSLVALYRLEMDDKNFRLVNKQLGTQYSILSRLARKYDLAVLVTNQIYSKGDDIELTSRTVARYWSKTLVELKRTAGENNRAAILRKHRSMPEGRAIEFKIEEKGLKETGRFSIF